jgi:hypothetical protein
MQITSFVPNLRMGGFHTQHAAIWEDLLESDFMQERHFASLHTLKETGQTNRKTKLSSEIDLNVAERSTVEVQTLSIIEQLYGDLTLQRGYESVGEAYAESLTENSLDGEK